MTPSDRLMAVTFLDELRHAVWGDLQRASEAPHASRALPSRHATAYAQRPDVTVIPAIRCGFRSIAATASVLGAACADADPSHGSAAAGTPLPAWTVVQELRIGALDDPEQALGPTNPNLLAVAPNGDIHVGQPQSGEIRTYDSTGALVRVIGGRGRGPGEFMRMVSIGLVEGELYGVDLSPAKVEERMLRNRAEAERLARELGAVPTHYPAVLGMRAGADGHRERRSRRAVRGPLSHRETIMAARP